MSMVHDLKKEIFKEVWEKAEAQGFVRSTENGDETSCAYRATHEGKTIACNVGFLIPDDKYDAAIEGTSVESNVFVLTTAYSRAQECGLTETGVHRIQLFLMELQEVHDEADNANDHKQRLYQYGLNHELIDEAQADLAA